ncbi:type I secretion system permease/ATPase [Salinarimonas sp.]|uniref:type I secretion system permease/ATPase n=1 Tax=Salinarimonas sp. TaxID=2766526 RepID=UPI0032D913BC
MSERRSASDVLSWRDFGGALAAVFVFSAIVNVLMLTGAVFMLETYDRVLPSRSVPTLVGLGIIVVLLYALLGYLDGIRGRLLARIGARLDERAAPHVFRMAGTSSLHGRESDGIQVVRDLDTLRGFLAGNGPASLFDLPWLPFYLFICFAFHPLIGWTATLGAAVLVVFTVVIEWLSQAPAAVTLRSAAQRNALGDWTRRNADVVWSMGMASRLERRWLDSHQAVVGAQIGASDVTGGFSSASRASRLLLQSAVLGVGAYLVILGEMTPGLIIASAIIAARALAPIEGLIANWRGFVAARHARTRLRASLRQAQAEREMVALPPPRRSLSVKGLAVAPPGVRTPVVQGVEFRLETGQGLGIIGPSGAGKSTLGRVLVGAWKDRRGEVRLDGSEISHWRYEDLGRHIGFLPQEIALCDGTIAENISRFEGHQESEAILAAARAACVDDLVQNLPDGYNTRIGEGGYVLSAGQKQRIALARALYGDPFLVVLDEPNANLDAVGERALTTAIRNTRARGGIVVVIAHRTTAIASVDMLLVIGEGRMQAFGPKDEVLPRVTQRAEPHPGLLKVVGDEA